jgi:hypothetical protein
MLLDRTKTAILEATTGAYSCNHPLMECAPLPLLKRMRMTGLDLAAAIPNFDARYHDFRADPDDPQRIWCQMRVTGTQTGQLFFGGLGGVSAKPRDPPVTFSNPPEAVSLKFDDEGRVRQITTGYPLDRRCGTTGGLGGLFGVFEGLGYPLPTPLTRTSAQVRVLKYCLRVLKYECSSIVSDLVALGLIACEGGSACDDGNR